MNSMHSPKKRQLMKGAIAMATTASGPSLVFAQTKRRVSFTQSWLPEGGNLFMYVAKARGFFSARGIDIDISRGYGSGASSEAVALGKFDFGGAVIPADILQSVKGLPIINMAVTQSDATMGIAVLADSPIRTPKDLEGRTLGSTVTSAEYPFLELFASKAGLNFSKVRRVQLDAQVRSRALITRQVDAVSGAAGSLIPGMAARDIETRFFPFRSVGVHLYGLGLITRPQFIRSDPGLCKAVIEASLEGVVYALENPDESLDIFRKEVPEFAMAKDAKEQNRIAFGMNALVSLSPDFKAHGMGWQDPAVMANQVDMVMKYMASKNDKRPEVSSLYTNLFVGSAQMTDGQWRAASTRFAPYRKYVGLA